MKIVVEVEVDEGTWPSDAWFLWLNASAELKAVERVTSVRRVDEERTGGRTA